MFILAVEDPSSSELIFPSYALQQRSRCGTVLIYKINAYVPQFCGLVVRQDRQNRPQKEDWRPSGAKFGRRDAPSFYQEGPALILYG